MDPARFLARFHPAVRLRALEVTLQQREVHADKRRQREALMLELIVACHLRLPVIVDKNEALLMHDL